MEILCTNDDGVFSPGLAAAVEAARTFAKVHIAAPSGQKTGAGRSLMGDMTQPLSCAEIMAGGVPVSGYHLEATPALVVRHALETVLKKGKIDLAVSGINYGENIGYDISLSGTVGAAIECAARGIPAIAVSLQTDLSSHRTYGKMDWNAVQFFLRAFIHRFIQKGGFVGFDILKIDVPLGANEKTEWKMCALQRSSYFLTRMKKDSPDAVIADGRLYLDPESYAPGTDAYALAIEKKVAVTPLVLDWTAREAGAFFA
jgi:5'-nucleotidase